MVEMAAHLDGNLEGILLLLFAIWIVSVMIIGLGATLVINVFTDRQLGWGPLSLFKTGLAVTVLRGLTGLFRQF